MSRAALCILFAWVLLLGDAHAQVRAWLDRDQIAFGETTTLNIETRDPTQQPDIAPLSADFDVLGQSSKQTFQLENGRSSTRLLFAIALRPRGPGVLRVPSLRVGSTYTQALRLLVTPPGNAPQGAGADAFIETVIDSPQPYVQQAVGMLVRLHYAVPLLSGQLDQDVPDGASLQRVGEDAQFTREIGGRRYNVVERRYLLVPERSGTLVIPGARFNGQGAGGLLEDLLGGQRTALTAGAPVQRLQVLPIPATAAQPWLPLRDARMTYLQAPQMARVGEAVTLEIQLEVDGASAAQLPALALPADPAVQVFADPPQLDEQFVDGRPRTTLRQRIALVPLQPGALQLPGPRLDWFDVQQGIARTTQAPTLQVQVHGSAASPAMPPQDAAAAPAVPGAASGPAVRVAPWMWFAAVAIGVLLALVIIALNKQRGRRVATSLPAPVAAPPPRLAEVLRQDDLAAIAAALAHAAGDAQATPSSLRARLQDEEQRRAIDALQAARWGDGDAAAALTLLRKAFAGGPRWITPPPRTPELLPPLYPPG